MANFREKRLTIQERKFLVQVWKFSNGAIVSITEGQEEKLGSLDVTVTTAGRSSSNNIIPSKYSILIPKLLGEMISSLTSGISITSLFLSDEINSEIAQVIMKELKSVISDFQ